MSGGWWKPGTVGGGGGNGRSLVRELNRSLIAKSQDFIFSTKHRGVASDYGPLSYARFKESRLGWAIGVG